MLRKSIIQGRLDFGSAKSFDRMFKMYEYRIENFYKNDVLFKDDVFDEENHWINIPRLINTEEEKLWTNTIRLLEYLAQFATGGKISAWLVHEGKILKYAVIEPRSEKAVVQSFLKGKKLASVEGKEEEALAALTKVIEQDDSHALAYEKRGFINYLLGNLSGAIYDFNKCISYDPSIPSAYYWRAKVHMRKEDWQAAIEDLELATRKAIALQPIYWKARRRKAWCHYNLKEYDKAVRELKLFTSRKFEPDNPNVKRLRQAWHLYAVNLMHVEEYEDALKAIDKALTYTDQEALVPSDLLYTLKGKVLHALGQDGMKDLKKAAEMGSEEATRLIAEYEA